MREWIENKIADFHVYYYLEEIMKVAKIIGLFAVVCFPIWFITYRWIHSQPQTHSVSISYQQANPVSTTSTSNGKTPAAISDVKYYDGELSSYELDTAPFYDHETAMCAAVVVYLKMTGRPKPVGIAILAETDNVNIVGVDLGARNMLYLTASQYHHADCTEYWKISPVNSVTLQIAGMSGQIAKKKENDREDLERQDAAHDASQSSGGAN